MFATANIGNAAKLPYNQEKYSPESVFYQKQVLFMSLYHQLTTGNVIEKGKKKEIHVRKTEGGMVSGEVRVPGSNIGFVFQSCCTICSA